MMCFSSTKKYKENKFFPSKLFLTFEKFPNSSDENSYDNSMHKLRLRIYEANREAARFFYTQLNSPSGKNGLDYLHGRQL